MDCDYCDGLLDPEEAEEARTGGRAICDECLAKEHAAEQAAADDYEAAQRGDAPAASRRARKRREVR